MVLGLLTVIWAGPQVQGGVLGVSGYPVVEVGR
jgi:hypothetical protein